MIILILITVFCRNTEKCETDKFPSVPKQSPGGVLQKRYWNNFVKLNVKNPPRNISLVGVFTKDFIDFSRKPIF